ncbi:MAG: rcc01693 family protein [Pseudomonadota bacterium]
MADTNTDAPVDWPAIMRLGLGRLGLTPETFWAMSPVEFQAALEGAGVTISAAHTLNRAGLTELMAAFPDRPSCPDGGFE